MAFSSEVCMKGILLVLTLLIELTSAAIAGDKHDRNAAPRHRSPYMAPTKTVTKPQSVNDQLNKLERETAKTPGPAKKTAPGAVVPKPSATERNKPIDFKSSKPRSSTVTQKGTSTQNTRKKSGMGRGY